VKADEAICVLRNYELVISRRAELWTTATSTHTDTILLKHQTRVGLVNLPKDTQPALCQRLDAVLLWWHVRPGPEKPVDLLAGIEMARI
jgi:hypothetical protein